jgi:tRNA threonylcarbamoyladenosine biosynthesis protein TsaB
MLTGLEHSSRLLPSIHFLLNSLGLALADIDALAVASGPGSFTGIRIGLATAKSLAETLGKKIVSVTILEALAYRVRFLDGLICPLLDAQRKQVYAALYEAGSDQLRRISPDVVMPPEAWIASLPRKKIFFVGDGAYRYEALLRARRGARWKIIRTTFFLADAVAQLGYARLCESAPGRSEEIDGYYIRPADAEMRKT